MEKRWKILPPEEEKSGLLREALKIHPVLCRLLVQRGFNSFEKAKSFFRPSLNDLHSPWLMKDMDKATARILEAKNTGEKILVYGDYDVDGTTAVASMYSFLKKFHPPTEFYIPHRYREGYGVSKAGINFAKANGYTLIIALDCGIKSIEHITYAKSIGIDFIVCDHHLPDEMLPPAVAILNAKQKDCRYPYKDLCGCGVGFKLMMALAEKLSLSADMPFEYLDLVTTAIAADIVPITGENRIIAFHGIKKVNKHPNEGIGALIKLSGLTDNIQITNLVFMIAPRVNAAGRMDDAKKAVQLFISENAEEAMHFAELLHSDNTDRKEADKTITAEALAIVSENTSWTNRKSTVVYQPHWHKGVVGIVASRMIEQYFRPTIVLTKSGDYVSGSARSVPGFNLYEAIHSCREHLLGYGGHFAAAGMTMEVDQVDAFREKFEQVVAGTIEDHMLVPEIIIDSEIAFKDIRKPVYDILCQMEPFGPENLRPVFITRKVENTGWSQVVKEEHIRFSLKQENVTVTGIGFYLAQKFHLLEKGKFIDVVFTIDTNEWKGETNLQIRVIDLRATELNC